MSQASIEISGPEAEEIGAELAAWWKSEMGEELRQAAPSASASGEGKRGVDPVAVVSLILSIPGAILATADLAKRIELTEKVARLIEWARSKRQRHPKLRIVVTDEQGRPIDLAAAKPPDVLEALGRRRAATDEAQGKDDEKAP